MENTHKKHRITLRQKAIASIFLIYALLTSYFLYYTVINQHRIAEEEMIDNARTKASLISLAISESILQKDKTFLQGFVKHVPGNKDIGYIRLVGREGDVLAEGGLQRGRTALLKKGSPIIQEIGQPEGLLHKSGHVFYISFPIMHKGKDVGQIYLGINTVETNRRLARATYLWVTFIIMTILTGSLLTFFLERRMRSSLKKLIQTAQRMAKGDLTQHVQIDIGDEVEELGESFNRMSRALAEKEKELVKSGNTMASIFNGITSGITYISKKYTIIYANIAYRNLLKDITGSAFEEGLRCFELLWQEKDVCVNCPGSLAMKTGHASDLEKEVILKNGERHVLWIHAYPVEDSQKNTVGFVEYIMDITQQRKLEDELKTYTEHLEEIAQKQTRKLKEAQAHIAHQEKMAALGQMAAGVAHEIGNPLSALSSLVRTLDKESQNEYSENRIKVMKEQVDRISKILREMTDFSKPATYRKNLTHSNQVIEAALGISKYDKRLNKIRVMTSLDNAIPALKLDGDKLLQVFLNIIFNAADAINGEGKITITSKLKNNSVIIQFEDTGPGIQERLLSRIFEPFFTTKEVGEGMGLGLSVSYGIVQKMGGLITASNRKGGGSVFTVKIPLSNSRGSRE